MQIVLRTATMKGGDSLMAKRNDEAIMSALIACGSIRRAAKAAGVSEVTVRKRLDDPAFRDRYDRAKNTLLSETCNAISARLMAAADCLSDVMEDNKNPATVRTSAADALLRHGLRYIEAANILNRLDTLEKAQINMK